MNNEEANPCLGINKKMIFHVGANDKLAQKYKTIILREYLKCQSVFH